MKSALIASWIAMIIAESLFTSGAALAPDLILVDGTIRTMDPNQPAAEAVALYGDRIGAIGRSEEVRKLAGSSTKVRALHGQLVLPGFNDAHVHFISGGLQLASVDLRDAKNPADFAERIRTHAAGMRQGEWLIGGNWDHESWPGSVLPTAALVDSATTNIPVLVSRLDGHMAVANSLALRLAGVAATTKNPPGGLIVREAKTGEPTGLLKDAAMDLVSKMIPDPGWEQKLRAARAASGHAARFGVTSVQDMSAGGDLGIYQELARRGELKTRIYAVWPLPRWKELAAIGIQAGFGNDLLRIGGLKGFADGSLGSTTALFFEPYADAPETHGLPAPEMFPESAMGERIKAADRAGLQVMVHAIGDKANDQVLAVFEQVSRDNGPRDRRFRIEHAQHLRPQDIPRFGRSQVVASMQPYHAADDGRWAEKRIGPERCRGTYAFRSLLDSGAVLAFGSDWTVAPLNPLTGIAAAVTRQTLDGKHPSGWIPEQKISLEEAVRAYTAGSAYAEHMEKSKGTIAPGKLADLVVLDRDIFKVGPADIERARVTMTIMGGQIVFESSPER